MAKNYNKLNEKALLLLVFSFLEKAVKENKLNIKTTYGLLKENSLKVFNIYKQLKYFVKSFANPKIQSYLGTNQHEGNLMWAVSAVVSATAPLFMLVMFFQRQVISGLTAGAVKG